MSTLANAVSGQVETLVVECVEPAMRRVGLRVVNRPGVLVGVAQVFASMNVNIDTLLLETEGCHPNTGDITVTVRTAERTLDLVCRKLERLLDVLDVRCS